METRKQRGGRHATRACHYCGLQPKSIGGIDRKDNAQGYLQGNCVPCCRPCNVYKHTTSYEIFVACAWLEKRRREVEEK